MLDYSQNKAIKVSLGRNFQNGNIRKELQPKLKKK